MACYLRRKILWFIGLVFFMLSIILTYHCLATFKVAYAIGDVVAIGLSIFILLPLFCNQVVEVDCRSHFR
jgi:hypothetical protein